jgi:hypothetical protein
MKFTFTGEATVIFSAVKTLTGETLRAVKGGVYDLEKNPDPSRFVEVAESVAVEIEAEVKKAVSEVETGTVPDEVVPTTSDEAPVAAPTAAAEPVTEDVEPGPFESPGTGQVMNGTEHPADGTWSPSISNDESTDDTASTDTKEPS